MRLLVRDYAGPVIAVSRMRGMFRIPVLMICVACLAITAMAGGASADPMQEEGDSIFDSPATFDLGGEYAYNTLLGVFYRGLEPFVYSFDAEEWLWVTGGPESSPTGFYFWRYLHEHWGWSIDYLYPDYFSFAHSIVGPYLGVLLPDPTFSPSPTPTPIASPTPTPGPDPTPTPTPIASLTPTPDPIVSPTPSPTPAGFSLIPAGSFTMGSPDFEQGRTSDEGPQHQVTLTNAFYIQQTPVTWAQWKEVREWALENGYTDLWLGGFGSHGDDRNSIHDPVTRVSWYDVVKWLNAKSEMDGLEPVYYAAGVVYRTGQRSPNWDGDANGYRLPTEAEWEYAARAGTDTAFYSGWITYIGEAPLDPDLDRIGWYAGNSDRQTRPVAQKEPNAWELYDMSGNVWEWCWDWSRRNYTTASVTDPIGPATGSYRIARGGAWNSHARDCRSANRLLSYAPGNRFHSLGFRPVRNAD